MRNIQNQNQNQIQNANNVRRFNNPFNLDPRKEDILIERKLERDVFCPLSSGSPDFGIRNEYYSIVLNRPLKESFCHAIQSLIFPNATFLQFSIILCYIITVIFIVLLCFGLDETNSIVLLQVKLSNVDKFGTLYPKKIKENPLELYRLLTFHFFHFNLNHLFFNLISLVSFCSTFEMFVKKHIFILILFLTGIFTSLSCFSLFNENERFCGLNSDINGILGAFVMLFIMNWKECLFIFNPLGRIITLYLILIYIFIFYIFSIATFLNAFMNFISLIYGAFLFAVLAKPIKVQAWKTIVRIISGATILVASTISLVNFYLKK